ncbi:relaxase/mobilization nuclease domain-containing protein [Ulvibacterium marinum]|uniref:relaxase/mobilization nuclease domain-containing protein n=1 Tax=Ulvibacterium marinum TaxID=2419782 RepID=UPI00249586FF|nr:relaxase/mobilization nuclease domain-containing protein [Ulvibacterium marinum]
MIGKGRSIAYTQASIAYGWNKDKDMEIVLKEYLMGENPREITSEFEIIQAQNSRCRNNTLSFVLSPTIEDGKELSQDELREMTQRFINEMELQNRQVIAFVHRNKEHVHVHAYVNRINFKGVAYNDSFIGKRSQHAAERVAKEMGLTTVKEVQQEKLMEIRRIRQQIRDIHKEVMRVYEPKDFDQYIKRMQQREVEVIPSINKSQKLQGFRFEYLGHNLKGSEVHRSMSGGKLAIEISNNNSREIILKQGKVIELLGKATELSANMALNITKHVIKRAIQKGMDIGMGI